MIYRLLALLVILGVLVGSMLLSGQQSQSVAQRPRDQPADVPGYAARDASLVETGDDGRPLYTLDAVGVRQRRNDKRVQLESPRMSFVAADGNRWTARATSGEIHEDGSHIELFGDVRVTGVMLGSDQPAQILTSILSYDTQAQLLTTHAPVKVEWSNRALQGSGLVANMKDRSAQLESAHGTVTP